MRITDATFVTSAADPSGYPPASLPEVAFVGRSNVGKSTLINALLNRKGLAKTSSTPGKTQLINFFLVNGRFHLVDLPGYGFAKVPMAEKAHWTERIETFLGTRETLKLVVALVDVRHGPTPLDMRMLQWLAHYQRPTLVVATKGDKLSRAQGLKALAGIRAGTGLPPVLVSASKGDGIADLWRRIGEFLFDGP
ncbi:MAG: YihA family ribosome biogenesis GTP-binding protein [Nitrospirae bacterium]|nr:YihA family ribosome biogenesis GTP-binding protein [Nitrospirota bacterium]